MTLTPDAIVGRSARRMPHRSSLAKALSPLLLALGLLAALSSAAEAQSVPSTQDIERAREIRWLSLQREELLESNRSLLLPAIGAGVGVATLVTGAVVYAQALTWEHTDCI